MGGTITTGSKLQPKNVQLKIKHIKMNERGRIKSPFKNVITPLT